MQFEKEVPQNWEKIYMLIVRYFMKVYVHFRVLSLSETNTCRDVPSPNQFFIKVFYWTYVYYYRQCQPSWTAIGLQIHVPVLWRLRSLGFVPLKKKCTLLLTKIQCFYYKIHHLLFFFSFGRRHHWLKLPFQIVKF